jgi:tRNA pseudouridine38-40 synthase
MTPTGVPKHPRTKAASRKIRLTVEYDGTDFAGWQVQPSPARTVQGALQDALARLPGEHGPILGAGRTDTGVHALAMTAHVRTSTPIKAVRLAAAINSQLPSDVRVVEAESTDASFEAQFSCQYRRYLYRLRESPVPIVAGALDRNRVLTLAGPLDWGAMNRAAATLIGTHDFASFATQETRPTVRTLHLAWFEPRGREMWFHVAADGFLRGMVRTLLGTLLEVGRRRRDEPSMVDLLKAQDRRRAGPSQPAHGLYFAEAGYNAWDLELSDVHFSKVAP